MDLDFFHPYAYEPRWFLSCGKTHRDIEVVIEAFRDLKASVKILLPQPGVFDPLPPNIMVESDQGLDEAIYLPLTHHFYRYSGATLITFLSDPEQHRALGVTNLLESMACSRPLIVSRTGALLSEIDVEKNEIGLYMDPGDASSLRKAVMRLMENMDEAREMGLKGRKLCEKHYNMDRFAEDLHTFFERL
jgi:glycosyltransferase involved in cell wall biosynthesis